MPSNIVFDRLLTMTVIGELMTENGCQPKKGEPVFVAADLMIKCGFTGGGILSIGSSGLYKNIETFEMCQFNTRSEIELWFKDAVMEAEDFYPIEYLEEDKVITHAVVNNICKRLNVWKCWVYTAWQVILKEK